MHGRLQLLLINTIDKRMCGLLWDVIGMNFGSADGSGQT